MKTELENERKRNEIKNTIYELFSQKINWSWECPPERRGAIIALLHELGINWERANRMSHFSTLPSTTCDVPHAFFIEYLNRILREYDDLNPISKCSGKCELCPDYKRCKN
jgi:hypothetical protein